MLDSIVAAPEPSSLAHVATDGSEGFSLQLSDEAVRQIKLLEQCSLLAEHRLGEFRVG